MNQVTYCGYQRSGSGLRRPAYSALPPLNTSMLLTFQVQDVLGVLAGGTPHPSLSPLGLGRERFLVAAQVPTSLNVSQFF